VYEELETFNTDRIGHGVRMMEDPNTVALARERGLAFEVGVTRNFQTGVVKSIPEHPLMEMLNWGLNLAIGTDNPSILRVNLTDEYHLICEDLEMEYKLLKERILAAGQASILPETNHDELNEQLRIELSL